MYACTSQVELCLTSYSSIHIHLLHRCFLAAQCPPLQTILNALSTSSICLDDIQVSAEASRLTAKGRGQGRGQVRGQGRRTTDLDSVEARVALISEAHHKALRVLSMIHLALLRVVILDIRTQKT